MILANFHTCKLANLHTCIITYFHSCRVALLHTHICASLHTFIVAWLHTCILAYLHTCNYYILIWISVSCKFQLFGGLTYLLTDSCDSIYLDDSEGICMTLYASFKFVLLCMTWYAWITQNEFAFCMIKNSLITRAFGSWNTPIRFYNSNAY